MQRRTSAASLLTSVDELFTTQAERDEAKLEKIQLIPLEELKPFRDHPFKVQNDAEMERIVESVRKVGVISPGLARPLKEGGYELVSGHRRLAACRQAGLETMPVLVREMTDDEAVIAMVDANLQREHVLPSEKAFAYKMKMEALKHQGTSCQLGTKLRTDEEMSENTSDSARQIQRYIRLTNLIPDLLAMVDEGKIAFNPAVEVSYLPKERQRDLLAAIQLYDCTPSLAQAIRMKRSAQEGRLDAAAIDAVMKDEKANQKERLKIPVERIRRFFPASYTNAQMEEEIVKMCEARYRKRAAMER